MAWRRIEFIERAKDAMRHGHVALPDVDLAYLSEGSSLFDDYVHAVRFAQTFAATNRRLMMERVIAVLREHLPPFGLDVAAINQLPSPERPARPIEITRAEVLGCVHSDS